MAAKIRSVREAEDKIRAEIGTVITVSTGVYLTPVFDSNSRKDRLSLMVFT